MQIKIKRYDKNIEPNSRDLNYKIQKGITLLKALLDIKATQDSSLSFNAGCRSGICGCCAVRVNDSEVLACSYIVKDKDFISPLNYHQVKRDLVVDREESLKTLSKASSWLKDFKLTKVSIRVLPKFGIGALAPDFCEAEAVTSDNFCKMSIAQEEITQTQTDCILCSSCYSACPVYAVNPDFIGPFALTRAFRYINDPREDNKKSTIDNIQSNGVWDCTLCGECTTVCPQGIDPKMDITYLRGTSVEFGYSDPNFALMSFGFDPNAGF